MALVSSATLRAVVLCAVVAGAAAAVQAPTSRADSCPADPSSVPGSGLSVLSQPVLVGGDAAAVPAVISDPSGGSISYQVEYGPTSAYGSCTSPTVLSTGTGGMVEVTVTGLAPSTTYQLRVIASDATGTAAGDGQTVTTLASGEIAEGVTVNGVPVGGLDAATAGTVVQRLTAGAARLRLGETRLTVSRFRLGLRVHTETAIATALQALPGQATTTILAVDPAPLRRYLETLSARLDRARHQGLVQLIGDHALVVPARPGQILEAEHAQKAITTYLLHASHGLLRLPVRAVPVPIESQKAVVIRLQAQTLTAYLNGHPVMRTAVTTGRPALPTPIGSYTIESRHSPYRFTSPWPKGSPYWYPPTPVTWAMYFYDNDFLHDDPIEPASAFGSGSEDGPYASHGCVHVPHDAMAFLWNWLPIGATVLVARS